MTKPRSDDNNGWDEWKNVVLRELKDIRTEQKETRSDVVNVRLDISRLQIKSGVWGAIGGAIPVVVLIAFEIISRGIK